MTKKIFRTAAFCAMMACPALAAPGGDFPLGDTSLKDLNAAPKTPSPAPAAVSMSPLPQKEWTVMIYMNGKNNIEKYLLADLDEMRKVGTTDKVNIAVEAGTLSQGSKVRRFLINKKSGDKITDTLYSESKSDMGNYKNIIAFMSWAKTNFPARRYMLVLWDHGMGWKDVPLDTYSDKGISYDDQTKNYVRTKQLAEILRAGGGTDVMAFNACNMQMAETAYEIKDYAGIIIASEEKMWGPGFDYEKILKFLNSTPSASLPAIGKQFVIFYNEFFSEGDPVFGLTASNMKNLPGTLSAVNPDALDRLPGLLDDWASAVMAANDTAAAIEGIKKTIRFGAIDKEKLYTSYADLGNFIEIVDAASKSDAVKSAGAKVLAFLDSQLIIARTGLHTDISGDDYTKTRGIAIEVTRKARFEPPFEESVPENRYADLAFAKAGKWPEFLKWMRLAYGGK